MALRGMGEFSSSDLAKLRIQTVEPWKRVVLGGMGFLLGGTGVYAQKADAKWLALLFLTLGAFCLLASIFGRKRTVDAALDKFDLAELFRDLF